MISFGLALMSEYEASYNQESPLADIKASDFIQAVFLHDFAKIWTYREITEEDRKKDTQKKLHEKQQFMYSEKQSKILKPEHETLLELAKYGISPSPQVWSAVCFAEGGWSSDHFAFGGTSRVSSSVNTENHLAVLVHMADLFSSQLMGKSLYK